VPALMSAGQLPRDWPTDIDSELAHSWTSTYCERLAQSSAFCESLCESLSETL